MLESHQPPPSTCWLQQICFDSVENSICHYLAPNNVEGNISSTSSFCNMKKIIKHLINQLKITVCACYHHILTIKFMNIIYL